MIHHYLTEKEIKNLSKLHNAKTCGQCYHLKNGIKCDIDNVIRSSHFLACTKELWQDN